jgi:hypothetical protein
MKNQIKSKINSFGIPSFSKQSIIDGFVSKELLKKGLLDKDIIVSDLNINQLNNTHFLNLNIFLRTNKLIKYRRLNKSTKQKSNLMNKDINVLTNLFNKNNTNKNLNLNNLVINIKNVNAFINNTNLDDFFDIFKKFNNTLFARGYNLFLDFVKLTTLLNDKQIHADTYLLTLGLIFKNLNKKRHSTFIQFIKTVCDSLIDRKIIKGIKFSISGRILGKTRASCVKVERGAIALNTIDSNNQFAKAHVYTIYGAYGLKLWISYN